MQCQQLISLHPRPRHQIVKTGPVMSETPKRPRSAVAKRERQRILTEVLSPTVYPSPNIPDTIPVVATTETKDVYKVELEWKGSLDTMEELVSPHTFRMDRSKCGVA